MMYFQTEKTEGREWLKETEFRPAFELKTESVFAQCNGYMGIRAAHPFSVLEENRGTFLAGVFHRAYEDEVTELVNCPDVTWMELEAEGEKIYPERIRLLSFERKLDILSGELCIIYEVESASGKRMRIENKRFASVKNKHLFVQRLTVKMPENQGEAIRIKTGINAQKTNSGVSHFHTVTARVYDRQFMEICGDLEEETVIAASSCQVSEGLLEKKEFGLVRRGIYGNYWIKTDQEGDLSFEKVTYFSHGEDGTDTEQRQKILSEAQSKGYAVLFEEHQKEMQSFWNKVSVEIQGITREEEAAVRFAQYHILGLTPWHTNECSIAAKGLTGEGYKGHVFWDTEIFIFPFLLHTYPEEARRLLEFRYRGLDGARKKARDFGFRGAMFPWEAAKSGEEETPLYAALNIHTGKANKVWSGIKEYHVTADIIYALEQYYQLTNDQEFMDSYGYEIAFEAARFWVSCGKWNEQQGRYEIRDVIGPDEYTEHVDNNAYTNYMAVYCVKTALKYRSELERTRKETYERLDQLLDLGTEPEQWREFVDKMYLPTPDYQGIIPQDDSFLSKPCLRDIEKYKNASVKQTVLLDYSRDEVVNMQVLKQADVVMLLNLYPRLFDSETVRKNVLFYEERTIHDSSLSYCAHAQACAVIGSVDLAEKFFEKSLMIDLDDNPNDSRDGIHSASLGGIWNCLIFGFAGVRFEEGVLYLEPHLPEHWHKMKFRLVISGTEVTFLIEKERITLTSQRPMEEPVPVEIEGKTCQFQNKLIIEKY